MKTKTTKPIGRLMWAIDYVDGTMFAAAEQYAKDTARTDEKAYGYRPKVTPVLVIPLDQESVERVVALIREELTAVTASELMQDGIAIAILSAIGLGPTATAKKGAR